MVNKLMRIYANIECPWGAAAFGKNNGNGKHNGYYIIMGQWTVDLECKHSPSLQLRAPCMISLGQFFREKNHISNGGTYLIGKVVKSLWLAQFIFHVWVNVCVICYMTSDWRFGLFVKAESCHFEMGILQVSLIFLFLSFSALT